MNVNPAMVVDSAMDAYMIGKRSIGIGQSPNPNVRKKQDESGQPQPVKQANAAQFKALAGNFLKNQAINAKNGILSPATGALTLGGLYSSMYGPEWAGGPSQQDIDEGNRFNGKRALKSVVTWNTLGRAMASVPYNTEKLINSQGKRNIALNAAKLAPGVIGGTAVMSNVVRGEEPDLDKAKRRMQIASRIGLVGNMGTMGYDGLVQQVAMDKAQKELMEEVANQMVQGGAQ